MSSPRLAPGSGLGGFRVLGHGLGGQVCQAQGGVGGQWMVVGEREDAPLDAQRLAGQPGLDLHTPTVSIVTRSILEVIRRLWSDRGMTEPRIALVTGANKGIGAAIAEGLSRHGMTVVVAARYADRGAATGVRLGARSVVLDVTDDRSVQDAAARVEQWYGRLDVLVNNAGISGGRTGQTPGGIDLDVIRAVFETNFFGVIRVTEAFLPLLRGSTGARMINVSGGTGSLHWQADPQHQFAARGAAVGYPTSKTALNMLTVQYAKALAGDGICVNAVAPGATNTDFATALGLTLQRTADQAAAIAVHLATVADPPTGAFLQDDGPVPW
jgi:NAD(P)-dependent dehydrogenase (short-subunit alcohol dehydrogenase family)